MNQFFYARKEPVKGTNPLEFIEFRDSFNINKVIRSVMAEDGTLLILLDDIHERALEVPQYDPKTGRQKGVKRERNTYQSELVLSKEDRERFFNLVNVE